MKGLLITFEGIEGSGKTTQIKLLQEKLKTISQNCDVVTTREPGGIEISERIRNIILTESNLEPETELFLFYAARIEHINKFIRPNLERGNIVLCDRFIDSSFAYQSIVLSSQFICGLNNLAIGNFKPDITLLLDIDPEIVYERISKRETNNRYDGESLKFLQQLRENFLHLARNEPFRFVTINANCNIEEVSKKIWECVSKLELIIQ